MPLDNSPAAAGILDIDQIVHQARGRAAPLPGAPAMPTGQPTALTPRQAPPSGPFGDIAPDIPLASRQVMAALSGHESGGRFNVLWTTPGTGPIKTFDDYSSHPKYQGWQGAPGPEGTSHAAGFLQWQPGTYDEGAALARLQRGPNGEYSFAPNSQLKVGAAQTADTYKRLTGGRDMVADWNAGYHQEVMDVLHSAGSPWAQNNAHTDLLTGWSKDDRERYQTGVTNGQKLMNEYMQEALSKPEGSEERANALRLAEQHRQQAEEQYQRLQSMPPAYTPLSPLERFGSAGVLVALLGGLLAKQGLTAALGAAGSAMQAENTGNMEKYKTEMERWKASSEFALANAKLAGEDISRVIDEAKLSYDERNARLSALASLYGMNEKLLIDDPIKYHNSLVSGMNEALQWQDRTLQINDTKGLLADKNALKNKADQDWVNDPANASAVVTRPDGTKVPPDYVQAQHDAEARLRVTTKTGQLESSQNVQVFDKDGKVIWQGSARERRDAPGWVDSATGQPLPEGRVEKRGVGQPRSAPAMFMQKFMQEHPDADSDALAMAAARYRQLGAMEQAFGSGSQGNTIRSLNVAIDHTDVLKQLSEALQNGDTQRINALKNRMLVEFGYEGPVNFDVAKKIVADEVVKSVLGNNVGTGAERLEMQTDFEKADSPQQLAGVIETARRLMLGQMRGLEQQYAGSDDKRKEAFRDKLFDHTKEALESTDKGGSPSAPSTGGVLVPAEHASDPDGTTYNGSDGKTYVKRGNQMVPQ